MDPTDKSICAGKITRTIPTDRIPVTAICRIKLEKFRELRKMPSVSTANKIHTAASASTIP
jgi:hypothetical protein